jgi:hypothetical protein
MFRSPRLLTLVALFSTVAAVTALFVFMLSSVVYCGATSPTQHALVSWKCRPSSLALAEPVLCEPAGRCPRQLPVARIRKNAGRYFTVTVACISGWRVQVIG